jgi:hypothetical protein
MDPRERDPQRLIWTESEKQVDPAGFERFCQENPQMRTPEGDWVHPRRFEDFCRRHPQLARRLREKRVRIGEGEQRHYDVQPRRPGEVVAFLARNQKIPSRYELPEPGSPLQPARDPFPALPTRFDPKEPGDNDHLDDDFDPFRAARAWYAYAQLPVPPADGVPGPRTPHYDARRYRLPLRPALIIFRCRPALAQTRHAQRLLREGWFDTQGWAVDEDYGDRNQWFPGRQVVLASGRDYTGDAWRIAHDLWRQYGDQTGLRDLSPADLQELERRAQAYRETYGAGPSDLGPELRPEQRRGGMGDSCDAHRHLYWRAFWRDSEMTNFPHFLHEAEAEMTAEARAARKLFAHAERMRGRDDPVAEAQAYEQGFKLWQSVLLKHNDFRRDTRVGEDTRELQLKYWKALQQVRGNEFKQLLVLQDFLTQAAGPRAGSTFWLPSVHLVPARKLPVPFVAGPLDTILDDGPKAQQRVRSQMAPGD